MPPESSVVMAWLGFLTPIALAGLAIVNIIIARSQRKRDEEVKSTLVATNAKTADKLQEVHTLVNSERGTLLEMYASNAEALAEITKTPLSIGVAKAARAEVEAHSQKQAIVDAHARGTK